MIADGEPNKVAPELYAKLRHSEQLQVDQAFRRRLAIEGRGLRRYPDNESPTSVARRAFQLGVYLAHLVWAASFALIGAIGLGLIYGGLADRIFPWALFGLGGAGFVVSVVAGVARWVEVRGYFTGLESNEFRHP
ncbi:hypothetical protein [Nocardioides terrisoli]|uniref:hypothetical protein n=1 Tax=Nocardioides terrisoli TaxID=3388267 RepID=UPI00287BBC67|nr:hypothetical protein [Nocardioides marmorisolisilvae]